MLWPCCCCSCPVWFCPVSPSRPALQSLPPPPPPPLPAGLALPGQLPSWWRPGGAWCRLPIVPCNAAPHAGWGQRPDILHPFATLIFPSFPCFWPQLVWIPPVLPSVSSILPFPFPTSVHRQRHRFERRPIRVSILPIFFPPLPPCPSPSPPPGSPLATARRSCSQCAQDELSQDKVLSSFYAYQLHLSIILFMHSPNRALHLTPSLHEKQPCRRAKRAF